MRKIGGINMTWGELLFIATMLSALGTLSLFMAVGAAWITIVFDWPNYTLLLAGWLGWWIGWLIIVAGVEFISKRRHWND